MGKGIRSHLFAGESRGVGTGTEDRKASNRIEDGAHLF